MYKTLTRHRLMLGQSFCYSKISSPGFEVAQLFAFALKCIIYMTQCHVCYLYCIAQACVDNVHSFSLCFVFDQIRLYYF